MIKVKIKPIDEQRDEVKHYISDDYVKYVHLVEDLFSGEFTACGNAYVDSAYDEVNKPVNCKMCLRKIRYYKNIKLKDVLAVTG